MSRLFGYWDKLESFWFKGIDSRVYALVRIFFAFVVLVNLVDLFAHRHELFTATGMIDASDLESSTWYPTYSLFSFISSSWAVTLTFIAAGLVMIGLGLGIAPRIATVLIFYWQISYHSDASIITTGWDDLLKNLSFLMIFCPYDGTWGLRQLLNKTPSQKQETPRYGLLLIQLQLAIVYWQTVWLKIPDESWQNGELISFFMLSNFSNITGTWWSGQLILSNILTFGTLIIEFIVPFLLWKNSTRMVGLLLGFSLHLGIVVVAPNIAIFSMAIMIPYLAFMTGEDIDFFKSFLNRFKKKRT